MKGAYKEYMDFDAIREKASEILEDTKEGLSIMDRYLVKHIVRTRTVVTDTKTGKKLSDTEDGYTREFSLFKALVLVVVASVAAFAMLSSIKSSCRQRKKIKEQKRQIKAMEKEIKKIS